MSDKEKINYTNVVIKEQPKQEKEINNSKETIVDDFATMDFPKEFSTKIFVRRKNKFTLPIVKKGNSLEEDTIERIGSEYKYNSVLRGLTTEEEKRYLREVLGVEPDTQGWTEATTNYWANLSRNVPATREDGTGGLELEVGLYYNNKQEYEADIKAIKDKNGVIINPKGTPINLSDYIMWRYCLLYSHVANDIKDVGKSPKIRFYLYSKEAETKEKYVAWEQKRKASKLYEANLHDQTWVDNVLRVLIINTKTKNIGIKDIPSLSIKDKILMLDDFVVDTPLAFLAVAQDKHLGIKSFIEIAIAVGVLNRIPNTLTVSFEGDIIGNTTEEVAIFLTNPTNKDIFDRVKALTNNRPS